MQQLIAIDFSLQWRDSVAAAEQAQVRWVHQEEELQRPGVLPICELGNSAAYTHTCSCWGKPEQVPHSSLYIHKLCITLGSHFVQPRLYNACVFFVWCIFQCGFSMHVTPKLQNWTKIAFPSRVLELSETFSVCDCAHTWWTSRACNIVCRSLFLMATFGLL